MNPITNAKNQNLMNEKELSLGHTGTVSSWHRQYKDSAWIYVGGLHYDLTEGDVICVFSQYGEIVNINLVRDKKTGVSKGFAFVCYEDQRSTVLATDNLNGIKLGGRIIRVDHVEKYRVPKDGILDVGLVDKKPQYKRHSDSVSEFVKEHGCGPEVMKQLKKIQQTQEEAEKRRPEAIQNRNERELKPRRNREPRENREPHSETERGHTSQRTSPRRLRNPSPSPPRKAPIKTEPPSPPRVIRCVK
ncbi:RNA-binding motif protein, X-linked 2 [Schistosoma japonicum]|uniref:RNA-binding motif protein, X-linked 2 n=1 Tax=Schistosoma japonicum TaxID=6182 RepID=A0A4Z2DU70_SCHJA|nr:RNA-binding motif protein, X-linked 2 [Schistosoma japonicum]TNN20025.1 RNA-binding motif protein, X-linked 2 [Schistosoma japonicum]